MSDNGDDVFTRLSGILEDWSVQIAQSHEELSTQIGVARGHLDRLLADGASSVQASEDAAQDTVAALSAEVERLTASLEAAQADLATRGDAAEEVSALEAALATAQAEAAELRERESALLEQLAQLKRTSESDDAARAAASAESAAASEEARVALESGLNEQSEINRALREELDAANETIENLAEQLREAQQSPADGGDDVAALQSALELLQMEHAAAQDEIRTLKQSLNEGGGGGSGIDAFDARGHKKRMGEILVEMGVLSQVQLKSLLKEQSQDPQRRLGAIAVEHGYTSEELVSRILAAQLRLPFEDLQHVQPESHAMEKVSPHVVMLHRCMPLQEEDGVLTVAMVNPLDLIAIEDLELASRCRVAPVVSTRTQIEEMLAAHYPES